MGTILNIDNPVWGLSLVGPGVIVEGIAAIRQRMDLAIRTTKGTDPLRPEFGSFVYKYIDGPDNIAIPNIKAEIIKALQLWVPEIKVVAIKHQFQEIQNPAFEVTYGLVDDDLIDKLLFDLKNGTTTTTDALNELILQASFPANGNNYPYTLSLVKNGQQIFPMPPPSGFKTLKELFDWASSNLFFAGRWYMLTDKIVCYMSADGVKTASLAIEVLPIVQVKAAFPELTPGQYYNVQLSVNGINEQPSMPQTFTSPGEVLDFAKTYWSNLDWSIEYVQPDNTAVFSDEFSDEFDIPATGYNLIGISHDAGFVGVLTIEFVERPTEFTDEFSNQFN